jgi:CDP-diacylglycerol--serine O-phosphatidyltransferase
MILDGLDGRNARLTNTQSEFGAQYDSLADMVSFGAAPALVMYEWSLNGLGKVGWVAAFIYCACAALRLARFNTNIEVVDKRFFQGLPSPAAAALVIGFIMMMIDPDISVIPRKVEWVSWCITVFAGLTMVSNVPFYSFKDINFRKSVPFIAVFLIALVLALLAIDPPKVLWPIFVIYGLSGYAVYVWQRAKGKRVSIIPLDDADDDLHR